MEKVDYDARLHAVYAAGRQMSPGALATWTETFARHLLFFVWHHVADRERLRMRAVSVFEHLSEEAVQAGFAKDRGSVALNP